MNPRQEAPSTQVTEPLAPQAQGGDRQRRDRPLRWLAVLAAGLVLTLLVRGLVVQSFYIPSGSMEPTLQPADRILVNKVEVVTSLQRGDLVVFDGTDTFADPHGGTVHEATSGWRSVLDAVDSILSIGANQSDYVKRVVGLPGDRVMCCDAKGLLTVNGVAVKEPYLYPGDRPSDLTFKVTVPAEHIWVMGDHRSDSADSRAHLGDPGGGMVRLDDVIGRAAMVYWPPGRAGTLAAPDALKGIPAGGIPAGTARERHK